MLGSYWSCGLPESDAWYGCSVLVGCAVDGGYGEGPEPEAPAARSCSLKPLKQKGVSAHEQIFGAGQIWYSDRVLYR